MIDTGSPICVFPRGAGEALGFDFTPYKLQPAPHLVDMVGRRWPAVPHIIDLTLPDFPSFSWTAEVLFFIEDWDMPFGILGQDGFLDRWAVSFNFYHRYFVIEPGDQFDERLPIDEFEEFQSRFDDDWHRPGSS